ncbi:YndM family protein [Oceanobacillus sp. Castelsardo]|uniref:YndM family protein n=1 Tax=Oceanobacillus sp. Castelsardo TaxID=1851204 RepID=UPI0018D2FECC|nr:YndM family protein [Oceanobacillus sp. Castelsardo]
MRHIKALAIKFMTILIILYSLLAIFESATLGEFLLISALVTGIAYIIGDLFILPRFNNVVATIADFGLAFVGIWVLSSMFIYPTTPIGIVSGFAAFFIAISEALFHVYMKEKVLKKQYNHREPFSVLNTRLQTEFSEEEDIDYIKKVNKNRE